MEAPAAGQLTLEERFQRVRSVGEECTQEDELLNLLRNKPEPVCYDGFEPSGRMHIAQGVMRIFNANKLTSAGCRVKILIADLFAMLNNKMGGDRKKIETLGRYYIEVWKAAGMDLEGGKVEFLWASEEIKARYDDYWPLMLDIASKNSHKRITSCCQIMGRSEQEELTAAQIIYPCMQCADVFFHKADICQLGMDQRSVNVLAREYCDDIKRNNKPIILSHHMLPGLQQGQVKMSKSDPSSSIFMDDEEAEVNVKIKKAYCPPKIVEGNPCLDYIKHVVLPWLTSFTVERSADNGGNKTFKSFEELVADYESGELHPGDLKPALSKSLNKILEPVREHFRNDSNAKELLKRVKAYKVTNMGNVTCKPLTESSAVAMEAPAALLDSSNPNPNPNPTHDQLTLEQRFRIVRSIGEECIQEDELLNLLRNKPKPVCYDGFEPSGRMHIAQGVMKTLNVNKLTSAGCHVKLWIADWFAKLNNKMGGDLEKIETNGRYFIEIWKAMGMDLEGGKVEFLWASKEIRARQDEYWPRMLDIAQRNSHKRIIRCCQIMGRSEQEELTAAQIIYPCMQCADVFFLNADVCQLGLDQRKVNVLAREYCDDVKRRNKPIILSHHMLPGLQQGQEKMSKSDPSSSIFMEDEEAEVNAKIKTAYCPPKIVERNPCLEYAKYIVLPSFNNEFTVERGADNGGNKTFKSFEELVADYESGDLHPSDLKTALSKSLNIILERVREHFRKDSNAKEILKRVKAYTVTK